jgi:hypothetical protein
MGLFDKAREAAEAHNAAHLQEAARAVDAQMPPGAPRVRIDELPVASGMQSSTLELYIGTVGLQPEDVYGLIPRLNGSFTVGYKIVYRDRPEYESGRTRWAANAGA